METAALAGDAPRVRSLLESLVLWDDFGSSDLWDRVRPTAQNDQPGVWLPPSIPSDRRHGARWPVYRNQTELDQYRQQGRIRVASNPYAQGLLENLTNNVIGKGYAYTVEPRVKKGQKPTPDQERAAEQAQIVLDRFLDINDWNGDADNDSDEAVGPTREREIYQRVRTDGEAFVRFHFQDDGTTLTRFIEADQVRDPPGALWTEGWSYGLQHQMRPFEDVQKIVLVNAYWPDPSAPGGEGRPGGEIADTIDAAEVVHVKGPSTPSTVKRGLSSFLFGTGSALDRAEKGQRAASLSAAVRASTAEFWQHQTATQASVSSLVSQLSGGLTQTDSATGQQTAVERVLPASIRRLPAGQELVPNPPDQSQSYQAAFQGDIRMAAASFCAPEFWAAETSSGNYSNLESAAAPAVRAGQAEQEYYRKVFSRCCWKALKWSAECGLLPEDVRKLVRVNVEAPAVLHRNELEQAQEDQIAISVGWMDRQSAAERRGLDWDTVLQRNQEYQAAMAPAMGELGLPGGAEGDKPPQQGGNPNPTPRVTTPKKEAEGDDGPPGGNPRPKPRVTTETKDASGHDHDALGRFGSGGGGVQTHRKSGAHVADPLTPAEAKAIRVPATKIRKLAGELDRVHDDFAQHTEKLRVLAAATYPQGMRRQHLDSLAREAAHAGQELATQDTAGWPRGKVQAHGVALKAVRQIALQARRLRQGMEDAMRFPRTESAHEAKDAQGHEHGPDGRFGHTGGGGGGDKGGGHDPAHKAAAKAMAAAHPAPGPAPVLPPGASRPDLIARDPKLAAAVAGRDAHMARQGRYAVAANAHDMLNEPPPRPVPPPPPEAPPRVKTSRAMKAIDAVSDAQAALFELEHPSMERHRAAVAGAHEHGAAALKAAREEGRRRLEAAIDTARQHIAGLPDGQRQKAEARLKRELGGE